MTAPNINMFLAELLVDELVHRGVTKFCISPGSRSTPLTLAASQHPDIDTNLNLDERSSAYFAVGYARATGRAAALICTSGTAGANYFPAVIEAYHSRLPMVVITADRPEELQDVGANQTIDQRNLYGHYVSASVTVEAPDDEFSATTFLNRIDAAMTEGDGSAPIHINCRFREPLALIDVPYDRDRLLEEVDKRRLQNDDKRQSVFSGEANDSAKELLDILNAAEKGLIIAAPESPVRACRMIAALSDKLHWPVVSDILSQTRFGFDGKVIAHHDLYLDIESIATGLRPNTVLHVGGLPTSKRLNQFLAGCKAVEYIKIQNHVQTIDPDHLETRRIVAEPDELIEAVVELIPQKEESEFYRRWMRVEYNCTEFLDDYLKAAPLSEVSLAGHLARLLPDGGALYLSSSMPVRDADMFMAPRNADILVGANRGASGIDGVIASACGFAEGGKRSTTLLVGDLALIHDLNSLAMVRQSSYPMIVIVVNNNGGGIFHFLPVADATDDFERLFATPHGLSFDKAAALFDLPYGNPKNLHELSEFYQKAIGGGGSCLIEIGSNREENLREHESIRSRLKNLFSR